MNNGKNMRVFFVVAAMMFCGLLIVACADPNTQSSTNTLESVSNDSVELGTSDTVTEPDAGKVLKPTQSQPDKLQTGSTAPPKATNPVPDLLAATTGVVPVIPHGDANGTDCLTCHASVTSDNPLPQDHVDAQVTNDYCLNCHKDA